MLWISQRTYLTVIHVRSHTEKGNGFLSRGYMVVWPWTCNVPISQQLRFESGKQPDIRFTRHSKSWVTEDEIRSGYCREIDMFTCQVIPKVSWSAASLAWVFKGRKYQTTSLFKNSHQHIRGTAKTHYPIMGNYFLMVKRMESLCRPNILVWQSKHLTKGQQVSQEGIHFEQCKIDRRIIRL